MSTPATVLANPSPAAPFNPPCGRPKRNSLRRPHPRPLPPRHPQRSTAPSPTVAAPLAASPVQAFINVGSGPFPQAAAITTGGASPWYNSTQLTNLFGGQPTAQQIQSFDNAILQRVQQTFSQSGISVSLTENPNTPALHTISLVSNTASATLPNAIGMTQVGGNGFSFIDQIAPSTQSLDQLEWIAAHNISHELMLAFGVPENYDKTGTFIDSKIANWAMMVNPTDSTFQLRCARKRSLKRPLPRRIKQSSISQLGAPGSRSRRRSRANHHRHLGPGRRRPRHLPPPPLAPSQRWHWPPDRSRACENHVLHDALITCCTTYY